MMGGLNESATMVQSELSAWLECRNAAPAKPPLVLAVAVSKVVLLGRN